MERKERQQEGIYLREEKEGEGRNGRETKDGMKRRQIDRQVKIGRV
jgi:hypothetical protein